VLAQTRLSSGDLDLDQDMTSLPGVTVEMLQLSQSSDVITPSNDDDITTSVTSQRRISEETVEVSDTAATAAADDDGDDDDDDDVLSGVDSPTEQRLMRQLLRRYEKAVRPVRNASDTVMVRMGLTLTQIFNMVSSVSLLSTCVHHVYMVACSNIEVDINSYL